MELTATQIKNYIDFEESKHRATLNRLKNEGKSYRSRDVIRENSYLAALTDIRDCIEQPARNEELHKAMVKLGGMLKS